MEILFGIFAGFIIGLILVMMFISGVWKWLKSFFRR